jgi:hypothetical protein
LKDTDLANRTRTGAIVGLAAGAALMVVGIVLVVTTGTSVRTESGKTVAHEPRLRLGRDLGLTAAGRSF